MARNLILYVFCVSVNQPISTSHQNPSLQTRTSTHDLGDIILQMHFPYLKSGALRFSRLLSDVSLSSLLQLLLSPQYRSVSHSELAHPLPRPLLSRRAYTRVSAMLPSLRTGRQSYFLLYAHGSLCVCVCSLFAEFRVLLYFITICLS